MFGPIFSFELLRLARRRSHYVTRFVQGALFVLLIYLLHEFFVAARLRSLRPPLLEVHALVGITSLVFFTICQFIGVLAITPALTATAITEERERKTFHYLLASPLTGAEIVLGKLASRLTAVFAHVLLGLPILSILTLAGGIDPSVVVLVFAASISTAFAVGSASILISILSKRGTEATSFAYIMTCLWLILPPLANSTWGKGTGAWDLFFQEWIKPANDVLIDSSPFAAMFPVIRGWAPGVLTAALERMIGIQFAFGAIATAVAIPLPRFMFRLREDRRSWYARLGLKARRAARPPIGDDPMIWKECQAGESALSNLRAAVVGLSLAVLAMFQSGDSAAEAFREFREYGYSAQNAAKRQEINIAARVWTCGAYFAWIMFVNVAAARGVTRERESDTWESLLASELTAEEIVRGKLIGPAWRLRFLAVMMLAITTFGLALGAVHPLGWLAQVTVIAVGTWYVSALGLFCSLRSKSSGSALTKSIGVLMFQNVGYLLILALLGMDNFYMPLASSPWIVAAAPTSIRDVGELLGTTTYADGFASRYGGRIVFTCVLGAVLHILAAYVLTRLSIGSIRREIDPTATDDAKASPMLSAADFREQATREASLG